jgi:hypothetical protein
MTDETSKDVVEEVKGHIFWFKGDETTIYVLRALNTGGYLLDDTELISAAFSHMNAYGDEVHIAKFVDEDTTCYIFIDPVTRKGEF